MSKSSPPIDNIRPPAFRDDNTAPLRAHISHAAEGVSCSTRHIRDLLGTLGCQPSLMPWRTAARRYAVTYGSPPIGWYRRPFVISWTFTRIIARTTARPAWFRTMPLLVAATH
jgi:hypothetical protein